MKKNTVKYPSPATIAIGTALLFNLSSAQAPTASTPTPNPGTSSTAVYVSPSHLPSIVKAYLNAIGTRMQAPGQERATMTGVYSDSSGPTAGQLIWQAPGNLRFDRSNRPGQPLIYTTTNGLVGASTISAADASLLESLLDDSVESFLYGYGGEYAHRFLGGLFRAASSTSATYAGPWYEIHEVIGRVHAQSGDVVQTKAFYFDSGTKLLLKVSYSRGNTKIETDFRNWLTLAGQSFPGKISRTENGVEMNSFTIATASTAPAASDGIFSGGN